MITIINTEAELHELLDSLTDGQIVTATWVDGEYHTTITGPIEVTGTIVFCRQTIRFTSTSGGGGCIFIKLTSLEATVEQPVTVTRDDPASLLVLIESLTGEQLVTAEWRSKGGERVTIITGPVRRDLAYVDVWDMWNEDHALSEHGDLPTDLHSVTTTVAKTIRWEREA